PLPVTISAAPSERLPAAVEAAAYFVVDEALTNVARHAGASAATIRVEWANGQLAAEVMDDGRGGADPALGTGLQGIADRVGAVSGRLELVSPAGGGTRLAVVIPISLPPRGEGSGWGLTSDGDAAVGAAGREGSG